VVGNELKGHIMCGTTIQPILLERTLSKCLSLGATNKTRINSNELRRCVRPLLVDAIFDRRNLFEKFPGTHLKRCHKVGGAQQGPIPSQEAVDFDSDSLCHLLDSLTIHLRSFPVLLQWTHD
jgi:hypothetical protein